MYRPLLVNVFLLLLIIPTVNGQSIIHPGDANNNGTANHVDLLYLGQGFGASGPARDSSSIIWTPQLANFNWQLTFSTGINYAFFDCNGDGEIDADDSNAIETNYGQVHGQVVPDSNMAVASGAPPLSLEFQQDSFTIVGDSLIMVNIILGSSAQPVNGIYGLAFTVDYDASAVDSIFYSLPGGFVSGGTFTMHTGQVDSTGKLDLALTRTNQTNASGYGVIGTIGIVMDDDLRLTSEFSLPISISEIHALGQGATPVGLTPVSDTLFVSTVALGLQELEAETAIFPQPAVDRLVIRPPNRLLEKVELYNIQGILVRHQECKGRDEIQLELGNLPNGSYFLLGRAKDRVFRKKVIVLRR